jgi:hypothetical protein
MIKNPRHMQLLCGLLFAAGVFLPPHGDHNVSASPNLLWMMMVAVMLYLQLRIHPEAAAATPWKLALDISWIPAGMVGIAMVVAGFMEFHAPETLAVAGFSLGFGLIVLLGQVAALLVEVKLWINRRADA